MLFDREFITVGFEADCLPRVHDHGPFPFPKWLKSPITSVP